MAKRKRPPEQAPPVKPAGPLLRALASGTPVNRIDQLRGRHRQKPAQALIRGLRMHDTPVILLIGQRGPGAAAARATASEGASPCTPAPFQPRARAASPPHPTPSPLSFRGAHARGPLLAAQPLLGGAAPASELSAAAHGPCWGTCGGLGRQARPPPCGRHVCSAWREPGLRGGVPGDLGGPAPF